MGTGCNTVDHVKVYWHRFIILGLKSMYCLDVIIYQCSVVGFLQNLNHILPCSNNIGYIFISCAIF